jgi:hypothetical protein
MQERTNKLLPTRALCERYGVVSRTIDRWEAAGVIPAPVCINGRRYWREAELEARERSGMSNTTTSKPAKVKAPRPLAPANTISRLLKKYFCEGIGV